MATSKTPSRGVWRWLRIPLFVLLGLLIATPAAIAVALQTNWARELIRGQTNAALLPMFRGRVVLDRLGHVGLSGVRGVDVRIIDPQGRQVIRAQGFSASVWLPSLARELISSGDSLDIQISSVACDHVEVTLRDDAEAGISLASTFEPREASVEESAPGTPLDFSIPNIALRKVWAHGVVGGSPAIDAELRQLSASLHYSIRGFELDLARTRLLTRGLPYAADPSGTVHGRLEVPDEEWQPLRLEASLLGTLAKAPALVEASMIGDDVYAWLQVAPLPGLTVNQHVPGLALQGDLALRAEVSGTLPELQLNLELGSEPAHVIAEGYVVVESGLEAAASVTVSDLNIAKIASGAPDTKLDLKLDALVFEREEGVLLGSQRLEVQPGVVAAEATPHLLVRGNLAVTEAGASARGNLFAEEQGITLNGSYAARAPARGATTLAVVVESELRDPERLRRLGVQTHGKLKVDGEWSLDSDVFTARASASLAHLDYRELKTSFVEVRGRAQGTLSDPTLQAAVSFQAANGRVHGDLIWSPQEQTLKVFAADLDAVALQRTAGGTLPVDSGLLNLDATFHRARGALSGSLETSARKLHVRGVGNGDFRANFKLERNQLAGAAHADMGKLGSLDITAKDVELPTEAFDTKRLASMHGELTAKGNVDLAQVSPLLLSEGLKLERTTGKVSFDFAARNPKGSSDGLRLSAAVETHGLRIVQQREEQAPSVENTAAAVGNKPLALEGIDFRVSVNLLSDSNEAYGTFIARDRAGTLAEVQAEAQLDGVWPARITFVPALVNLPLRAKLHVPNRRLQTLPEVLRPKALLGWVSVDALLEGNAADPRLRAQVLAHSLKTENSPRSVNVAVDASCGREGGEAKLEARNAGALVTDLAMRWRGDLLRAGEITEDRTVLEGSAEARLTDFPLDVIPILVDRQVVGTMSGDLKLTDWGKDARLEARLFSRSLSVADVKVTHFTAEAQTKGNQLLAKLGLRTGSGTTQASLSSAIKWGKRPAPELERQATARLSTRDFQLRVLTPLVGSDVSELSGVLDANTQLQITPTATQLSGSAKLEQGVVQVPAIGQRFSEISARVVVGDNRVRLEQFSARGLTGRVTATGSASLDGFALRGADAKVSIAKNEKLPLTLEGAAIGDAWGNVNVAYSSPASGERQLNIDVPSFNLITPETGGYGLQSMKADEQIRIGVRRSDGKFVALPVQPLEPDGKEEAVAEASPPLRIKIKLRNVTVERGRVATAKLNGDLMVVAAEETAVTGRIEVRGGKLDVQGKTFEIEGGVITFHGGEPGNPTITATARWDSPTEHSVYAEYVGDVENGKIKLRSEPPLSQDEIASLLLFGTPDGSTGAGESSDSTSMAVSVAGDTAAKGLNHALSDFTSLDVSARVDTSTGSSRPELVFQVTPRLAAKVTRAVGEPTAGESPDRTFLTLELRLKRAWALSALLGDRGASALDLIWRRRY